MNNAWSPIPLYSDGHDLVVPQPEAKIENTYFVGLDLGQVQDLTALAVIERVGGVKDCVCNVPYLKRYPNGTPYNAIVDELASRLTQAPKGTHLIVDGTGVGRAVTDMVRDHPFFKKGHCHVFPITITGGNEELYDGYYHKVPKRNLVGAVQVLLQSQRLKIARELARTPILVSELQNFKVKITTAGSDIYGECVKASTTI
jgi:hypothetical protein